VTRGVTNTSIGNINVSRSGAEEYDEESKMPEIDNKGSKNSAKKKMKKIFKKNA
jgi:hypothetical protein